MTTPQVSAADRERAEEIVGVRCDCNPQIKKHGYKCADCTMRDAIASALAQAREEGRPAPGFVRDSEGVDRKVVGKLAISSDNCLLGNQAPVFYVSNNGHISSGVFNQNPKYLKWMKEQQGVFSTNEAAEKARTTNDH